MLEATTLGTLLLLLFIILFTSSFIYQLSGEIFDKFYKGDDNEYNTNLSKKVIFLLFLAFIFLILAIVAVPVLTRPKFMTFFNPEKTGYIGDTIGGITNPFINTAAVIVTGLAFYMQYKANKLQVKIFRDQLDETKKQFDADQKNQRKQISLQKVENQFYEMLKLHKSNIDEIEYKYTDVVYKGRKVFQCLREELFVIYGQVESYLKLQPEDCMKISYKILFYGIGHESNGLYCQNPDKKVIYKDAKTMSLYDKLRVMQGGGKSSFGIGHSTFLAHIYRHLYVTVKFIASQPESLISYEDKRSYLRTLRAQLSNDEQAMLFYNWYTGMGAKWEESDSDGNKFFTDYRMIHNLNDTLLLKPTSLHNIFSSDYRKEKNRGDDFLFEIQG